MKIRFTEDVELEVKQAIVSFKRGDVVDVDLDREGDVTSSFQFGDGSMAYNVPNELFDWAGRRSAYYQVVKTLAKDTQGDPKLLDIAARDLKQNILDQLN
jgi:hypothetical protein